MRKLYYNKIMCTQLINANIIFLIQSTYFAIANVIIRADDLDRLMNCPGTWRPKTYG